MVAASAPHQPFEEVQMLTFTGAITGVGVHNALYAVEQFLVHQRLVPPLVAMSKVCRENVALCRPTRDNSFRGC